MSNSSWRKRLTVWRRRLYRYPSPEPMPPTRLFWLSMGLVALLALTFCAFYITYHLGRQAALQTSAEDMGIIDQAVWSVTHGQLLHQTICNNISDTNCFSPAGFSRFAIHFEPILLPVSLLYLLWPGPGILLIIQTLVVASGAFPAFWLARLRLRNELAAVGIAALYLLYPALQQAEVFDFHAVTLTSAFLLFMIYFLYTRRTVWLFVFAILAMACKEELPAVVALFGLWSILFQQRWRSGLGLIGIALGWLGLTLLMYHIFSPTGHPLLASRYSSLGNGPVDVLKNVVFHPRRFIDAYVLEPDRRHYLSILLAPAGYLPLLAPWVLILAVPSIGLNLLSSDRNQYLGVFQYNAEIVPLLIFATIEAMVLLVWAVQWVMRYMRERKAQSGQPALAGETQQSGQVPIAKPSRWTRRAQPIALAVLVAFTFFSVLRQDATYGAMPYSRGFVWPQVTQRDLAIQRIINMIPPSASVSAQMDLVPHVSQRINIYQFPYGVGSADYVFLDVTGSPYPYTSGQYLDEAKQLLFGGSYGVAAAEDGYLLLKRGLTAPALSPVSPASIGADAVPDLPDDFCSFVNVPQKQVTAPLDVDFTPDSSSSATISLVGFHLTPPSSFSVIYRYMQITTYWRVNSPELPPLRIMVLLLDAKGKERFASIDFPAIEWCPTSVWKPGMVVRVDSGLEYVGNMPDGLAHLSLALLPYSAVFGTMDSVTQRLPLRIVSAPASVAQVPGTNTLKLETFTVSF